MVILYQLLVHIICWTVRITVVKCKSLINHAHSKVPSWHCAGKTGETIKIKFARVSVQMHTRTFWREVIYKYTTTCPNHLLFKFLYLCSINFQWQLLFNHILSSAAAHVYNRGCGCIERYVIFVKRGLACKGAKFGMLMVNNYCTWLT
jgi:hypothetical protein